MTKIRSEVEEQIIVGLKQQIVKEMLHHIDLTYIPNNFFDGILKYRISCDNDTLKIIEQLLSRLYDVRQRKLFLLFSCNDVKPFRERMTDKEVECWESCNSALQLLKQTQYGMMLHE